MVLPLPANWVKISKIEGENDGFWITGQQGTLQSFYKDTGAGGFMPNAVGYTLAPGKYWVYPNLKDAAEKMVQVKNRIKPQKDNADVYKKAYQNYLDLYNS